MLIRTIGHSCIHIITNKVSLLIDPWLTERLDRLWVHWPMLEEESLQSLSSVNGIILTHHHCDHHNFQSLYKLPKTASVFFPESGKEIKIAGSGMGHQVIPFTLRRLGFEKLYPLKSFSTIQFGDLKIHTFPSNVAFPEQSFLIEHENSSLFFAGDSILHQNTKEYFENNAIKIDIAVLPVHSTSPHSPLTVRKHDKNYEKYVSISEENFLNYIKVLKPKYIIPSALGWKIDCQEEDNLSWANNLLFPMTINDTMNLNCDKKIIFMGPGDEMQLKSGDINLFKSKYRSEEIAKFSETVSFKANTNIPPFKPFSQKKIERRNNELLNNLMEEAIGTGYWNRALEQNREFVVRLTNEDADDTFLINLAQNKIQKINEEKMESIGAFTWLHSNTVNDLLNAELLIENSYGLWVSNDMLLSSVFHKPKYYINHLNNWLAVHV